MEGPEGRQESARDRLPVGGKRLDAFTTGKRVWQVGAQGLSPDVELDVVLAYRLLQDTVDYRAALRGWFEWVPVGGALIVVVPHAFLHGRRLSLPSPWRPRQRRLYTPASLLGEVEEALAPNTYRVRLVDDLDAGYDYALSPAIEPEGESDVALVVERIAAPAWSLTEERPPAGFVPLATPDFAFEPKRTRVEANAFLPARRILILKLDHLGDMIMGMPALRRARRIFADAHIDLVVGSWNVKLAEEMGVADRVIGFDAFPRNSSEEEPNVEATLSLFRAVMTDAYDLAIDLRTDKDTRTLLRAAKATTKAGIGKHSDYPFLDIFLPLDGTRNEAARAREDRIVHNSFSVQGSARHGHFGVYSNKEQVERDCAIVWGPYLELDAGDYIFDFYIDLEDARGEGMLKLDVALDAGHVVSQLMVSRPSNYHLPFRVERPGTRFEARIWTVEGHPSISFNFYGGRLIRRSPDNLLHQSEYATLLIELVKLRLQDFGQLQELAPA